jgi:cellulose synthase (UDP-forming)
MLFDYLHAFAIMAYLPYLAMSLLGFTPFHASGGSYLVHVLPMAIATEVWLLAANRPFNDRRGRQRHPYLDLWRARIIWTGLAPVYAKASLQAVFSGPRRKPVYKVTRKEDDLRWHWQHTTPQAIPVMMVTIIAIYAIVHRTLPNLMLLSATIYWGTLNMLLLVGFVSRGWHMWNKSRRLVNNQIFAAPGNPAT